MTKKASRGDRGAQLDLFDDAGRGAQAPIIPPAEGDTALLRALGEWAERHGYRMVIVAPYRVEMRRKV